MKNERRRYNKAMGCGLSMLFDMDTLKHRHSKSSDTKAPQVFVTMSPELAKRSTKTTSRQRRIKIAIMGKAGVGKSALVVRYLTKRYIGEYQSALETHASTELEIEEQKVLVEIHDTCQSTAEDKLKDHINWADGFILVFSITDYWSLYEVARLASTITQNKNDDKTPIVVISNQSDMEKQRKISRPEVIQFLNDLGKPVFRTSAADNYDSVRTAFEEASRLVYNWKFPPAQRKPRSRSGSFMDPLREAFTRHTSPKSVSEEEIPGRLRSASSADIDSVKKVNGAVHAGLLNNGTKVKKPTSEKPKFLRPFLEISEGAQRIRSHSFA